MGATTIALLYLATRIFDDVKIVKPMSSRVTGPEKYLAAIGFKGTGCSEFSEVHTAPRRSHEEGAGHSPLKVPLLSPIVSLEALQRDDEYVSNCRAMAEGLCKRQAGALTAILERAALLERG